MGSALAAVWKRLMLGGAQYRDDRTRLKMLYAIHDPWGMAHPREQYRFEETCRFLESHIDQRRTLLEIGCGEGHQSVHFATLFEELYGLDISAAAIKRARKKLPAGRFHVGAVQNLGQLGWPLRRFNLVTACEVLYYVKNPVATLSAIESVAEMVLVTYVDDHKRALAPLIADRPALCCTAVRYEETAWTIALRRPSRPGESGPSRDPLY